VAKGTSATPSIQLFHRHPPGSQSCRVYEPHRATPSRNPSKPLIFLPHTLSEVTGPVYGHDPMGGTDNDLTCLPD
jgi:protocatechuate 3,4-dioxygenase, beta subunit